MQSTLFVLRKESGNTQEELADLIGVATSTYRDKETGKTQFKLDEMFKIAQFYNKEIEQIFLFKETT